MHDHRMATSDETALRARLEGGLEALFGRIDPHQVDQLTALVTLLADWAPRMNLTGHRDPMDITSRLVLDAAALVQALPELDQAMDLADLGSGAGFPGLPIAVLRPHLTVLLVESRQKRHHFQREARRQLGLERVRPIHGRSDAVEVSPCDVVVAQAMSQPERALASMRPWARAGGILVLPASEAAERPPMPGQDVRIERRTYRVPFAGVSRLLWVVHLPESGGE